MIINKRFAPRWFILLLDLLFCATAMTIAFLLKHNLDFSVFNEFKILNILGITLLVNAIIFFASKSYFGVIRYTSAEDASRILLVNTFACVTFLSLDMLYFMGGSVRFPLAILIIYYVTVNFFLLAYRFFIKYLFYTFSTSKRKTIKTAIYNAQPEGLLVHKLLSKNVRSNIKIVAILDDSENLIGKLIDNTPVMRANERSLERLKKDGLELLILSDPHLERQKLNQLVDIVLNLNIRIQQIPSSRKWLNNSLEANQLKDINIEQLLERDVIRLENKQINQEIKGKKILVTGAAGSIGSEIVKQILKYEPAIIIACDHGETALHDLSLNLSSNPKVIFFIGDVRDKIRMEQIFEIYEPDMVYHAAAYKHVPIMENHPSTAVLNNVLGTKIIAELSHQFNVEKFVLVSTDKAVNPTNVMGASKRIAEIFVQSFNDYLHNKKTLKKSNIPATKFITTRFGNVLGSNGSVIPRFKKQIEEGGPVTVTHPDITRYFMTIPEACQLVIEAGVMGNGGEIFVFDMGEPIKIVDLAKKMIQLSGKIPGQDIEITFSGLRPGEKLFEELLNNAENTMSTYHEKIMIGLVRTYDFSQVSESIDELINLARKHIVIETVWKMKEIVPEYKSRNSTFEKMDKIL